MVYNKNVLGDKENSGILGTRRGNKIKVETEEKNRAILNSFIIIYRM